MSPTILTSSMDKYNFNESFAFTQVEFLRVSTWNIKFALQHSHISLVFTCLLRIFAQCARHALKTNKTTI